MKVNLYTQIEHDLEEAIVSGQLKPGGRIPSVNDLRDKYGVSHITVRRVYQDLNSKNLICKRGLGYVVRGKETAGQEVRTNTIGYFLRTPRPQNQYDNFFNEINAGIQRECALHGMNLYTPHQCSYLAQVYTLTHEKLEQLIPAMEKCAAMVDAYIVDERISDDILAQVMETVDKPFIVVNRRSELRNVDSIGAPHPENLRRGFHAARQMNYDALIYLQDGRDNSNEKELNAAFEQHQQIWHEVRVIPNCSVDPWKVTLERLEAALNELLKKKRRVLIFSGGGVYEAILSCLASRPECAIGVNCGIMLFRNFGYSGKVPVQPACFVINPERMAKLAVENLLERLREPNRIYNHYTIAPEIDLGESMCPINNNKS